MKTTTYLRLIFVKLLLLTLVFNACNKEDLNTERGIDVIVNGYNGSDHPLQVAIDTTVYNNSNLLLQPDFTINFRMAYSYTKVQKRIFTLTDTVTKKVVYSAELPSSGTKAAFNYLFFNNQVQEFHPPAADPKTNKLGFFIHDLGSTEPVDIFLFRKDATTGVEYREYLAKAVVPGQWVYVDYVSSEKFKTKQILGNSTLHFTKSNTIDQWAFGNSETLSKTSVHSFFLPAGDELGLVQPYFIAPNSKGQRFTRLFFYPDRL